MARLITGVFSYYVSELWSICARIYLRLIFDTSICQDHIRGFLCFYLFNFSS